ncbi:hypothetical protein TNCV_3902591 [Trichonephila clavipes]|nr:hypothetical protein TNCV_3902591 [Trichonephila clavipes]
MQQPMRGNAYCTYLSLRDLRHWITSAEASVKGPVRREITSVQFPRKLDTHFSTHGRDERLRRSCPARDLNPGPVARKRETIPLSQWALQSIIV